MARVTVEDCLENVESRFALVHLAVRRVLQLRRGSMPTIDTPKNKEIVVALREIASRSVTTENVRQFEEFEALPEKPSKEVEGAIRKEVEELMEAEAQHGVALEFEMKEEIGGFQGTEDTEEPT